MLLNIAQSHPRGQSFRIFTNCVGSGGGLSLLCCVPDMEQSHPRAQSFRIFTNCVGSGGGLSPLKKKITRDATDMPPSRAESAVLRR